MPSNCFQILISIGYVYENAETEIARFFFYIVLKMLLLGKILSLHKRRAKEMPPSYVNKLEELGFTIIKKPWPPKPPTFKGDLAKSTLERLIQAARQVSISLNLSEINITKEKLTLTYDLDGFDGYGNMLGLYALNALKEKLVKLKLMKADNELWFGKQGDQFIIWVMR